MVIRGLAESCSINFLVDTGSQATLVTRALVADLRLTENIVKTNCLLSSFTKDKITTVGEIVLKVAVAGICVPHTCIVVSHVMEHDILLGMDFLTENDISVHAGSRKVTSPRGSVPFVSPPEPIPRRTKVRASTTTLVPPNTVMFIKGKLDEHSDLTKDRTFAGQLEPYENLTVNDCLFTAAALTYSEMGELPIRIVNPTDDSIVIHRRKLVGFMTPPETKTETITDISVRRIANTSQTECHQKSSNMAESNSLPWTKEKLFRELKVDDIQIPPTEKKRLKDILWNHRDCFSRHEFDLGVARDFEAEIRLKPNAEPQYVPPIPIPYKRREAMQKHLDGMEKAGIIEEVQETSMWNSRVFLVPKPNQPGQFRFVADFRALNAQCLPDPYLLPHINHVVDKLGGAEWYSTFDLCKSFFQVNYDPESSKLTAFTANNKRYIFKKLVMGHMTSSSQFAKMMDRLLSNLPLDQICYFLDDLCLASCDVKSHLDRLELVLGKLHSSCLKLMPKKCAILKKQVQFVGLTISGQGIKINEDRVKAVLDIQPPRSIKEAQQLMGFLSYNRKFVKNFAALAKPIYSVIDKSKRFSWSRACQEGLEEIKRRIAEGITLTIPQVDDPLSSYTLTIDASLDGYGAELTQVQDGETKIIAYFSKRVPKHKRQWSQTKLEFEAMVEAIEHFAIYLKSTRNFIVQTDCLSLLALEKLFAKANATMIRRLNKLMDYSFSLKHLAGSENSTADFLSRYLHKKRECHIATQTEDIINTRAIPENIHDTLKCNRIETSHNDTGSEKSAELAELLIPPDMFNAETDCLGHELDGNKTDETETLDLSLVNVTPSCICDSDVLPDWQADQPKQIQAIVASTITEQLELPRLIGLDQIKVAQSNDTVLKEVIRWINKNERPKDLQKLRLPPDLVRYWKQYKLLVIRDGVLYRKWIKHDKETKEIEIEKLLVIVPESLRDNVLQLHHTSLITCHPGIEETYRQIIRQYYWAQMKDEIELFVKSCVTCGKVKQPTAYLKAPLKHVIAHELNDVLIIDHVVPEKEGRTPRNNRYILTMTDCFTGFIVAVPCKTRESEETIRLILHNWCLRMGYPKEIIADNDSSFTSEFFNSVLAYFKIKATHGTPYLCSSSSKVERANKRINTALRLTLTDKQIRDWDLYLNFVCFSLNALRSRHTGFSANFLVYGRNLNTPLDLELDGDPVRLGRLSETRGHTKYSEKAYQLYRTIRNIVQKARRHAALDFQYSDNYYNKNLKGPYFEEGDWVFTLINCPQHKFSERFQGPFKVIKKISDHLYVIELDDGKEKLVNISKLKRYVRSKYSPQRVLDPVAPEFIPTLDTTPLTEERVDAELASPDDTTSPISVELEIVPAHDPEDEKQGIPVVGETHGNNSPESEHNTWFDEDDAVIVDAPDTDPVAAPVLRRSTRITQPIDRFQAGV